jgi:DNA repair protein RadC
VKTIHQSPSSAVPLRRLNDFAPVQGYAAKEVRLLQKATALLLTKLKGTGACISSSNAASEQARFYLNLALLDKEREVFIVLFLDAQHCLIEAAELFRGTIDGVNVHPREVVKSALMINAAAVIFAHNHPSGLATPSYSDELITQRLKDALQLIDVRVVDHIVVAKNNTFSFAEAGIL